MLVSLAMLLCHFLTAAKLPPCPQAKPFLALALCRQSHQPSRARNDSCACQNQEGPSGEQRSSCGGDARTGMLISLSSLVSVSVSATEKGPGQTMTSSMPSNAWSSVPEPALI